VEIDETFIGGEEPGLFGGRQRGKKSLVVVAVEVHEPRALVAVACGSSPTRLLSCCTSFREHIEPGTTVITDGWQGYAGIEELGYGRERRSQRAAPLSGGDPHGLLPGVHSVASLTTRWLARTH